MRAAGGLVALDLVFAATGLALLWALRGFRTWGEVLRLAGLAYLLGVAVFGVLGTWALVAGSSVSPAVVVAIAAAVAVASAAAARRIGRGLPKALLAPRRPERHRWLGLACAAGTALYLANFLRAARLQTQFTLPEWDVWSSWTTKAKVFYFFGGLDTTIFPTMFMPGYAILVPALEAMAFGFMGAADTTLLHVQFWLLLAAFASAVGGLLRPAVPHVLVWPFLLLLVVLPEVNLHGLAPQADFTLDWLFAAGALCLALWIVRREGWLLPAAGILLAGAMGTKREGLLFAAALFAAALAATWTSRRSSWPRLVATAVAAAATTLPWHVWRSSHDLPDQLTGTSWSSVPDRLAPAAASVAEILFGWHFWLATLPLGVAAAAALLARGKPALPALYLITVALGYAGLTWALAAGTDYSLGPYSDENPVPRGSGALAMLTIALAPLMLAMALERRRETDSQTQTYERGSLLRPLDRSVQTDHEQSP